jgi:hypothetical protein
VTPDSRGHRNFIEESPTEGRSLLVIPDGGLLQLLVGFRLYEQGESPLLRQAILDPLPHLSPGNSCRLASQHPAGPPLDLGAPGLLNLFQIVCRLFQGSSAAPQRHRRARCGGASAGVPLITQDEFAHLLQRGHGQTDRQLTALLDEAQKALPLWYGSGYGSKDR